MIAEGDKDGVRYQFTGLIQVNIRNLPLNWKIHVTSPTGRNINVASWYFPIPNDKVIEWIWAIYDGFDFLNNLVNWNIQNKQKLFQKAS